MENDYQAVPPHALPRAERRTEHDSGLVCLLFGGLVGFVTGVAFMALWLL